MKSRRRHRRRRRRRPRRRRLRRPFPGDTRRLVTAGLPGCTKRLPHNGGRRPSTAMCRVTSLHVMAAHCNRSLAQTAAFCLVSYQHPAGIRAGRHTRAGGPATAPDHDPDASPRASRRTHRRPDRERELRRRRRRRKSQAGPFAATRRRRRRAAGPGLRPSESACEAPGIAGFESPGPGPLRSAGAPSRRRILEAADSGGGGGGVANGPVPTAGRARSRLSRFKPGRGCVCSGPERSGPSGTATRPGLVLTLIASRAGDCNGVSDNWDREEKKSFSSKKFLRCKKKIVKWTESTARKQQILSVCKLMSFARM